MVSIPSFEPIGKELGAGRTRMEEMHQQGRDDLQGGYAWGKRKYLNAKKLVEGYDRGILAPAEQMYLDTLGQNGPEGNARALENFHNTAGYQNAVNQFGRDGESMQRFAANSGNLASGNQQIALDDRRRELQDRAFDEHQTRLMGMQAQRGQGIASRVNAMQQFGNTQINEGKDLSQLGATYAPTIWDTYSQMAQAMGQHQQMGVEAKLQEQQMAMQGGLGIAGMFAGML